MHNDTLNMQKFNESLLIVEKKTELETILHITIKEFI